MYSDKDSVNILTALLVSHGIRHAVVCPGSRNAPIVHNLNECPDITCYPVSDERSAAFFALGIAQATDQPVVVCVTSGTALLNVAPAVADGLYRPTPQRIGFRASRPLCVGICGLSAHEACHRHCHQCTSRALASRFHPYHLEAQASKGRYLFCGACCHPWWLLSRHGCLPVRKHGGSCCPDFPLGIAAQR